MGTVSSPSPLLRSLYIIRSSCSLMQLHKALSWSLMKLYKSLIGQGPTRKQELELGGVWGILGGTATDYWGRRPQCSYVAPNIPQTLPRLRSLFSLGSGFSKASYEARRHRRGRNSYWALIRFLLCHWAQHRGLQKPF